MSLDLAPRVHAAIRRHQLIDAGERVLVAVSGGADSLALLHVLHELAGPLGVTLHVAHLEHGLRGEASIEDARFVGQEGARLGWPVIVERARVAEMAERERVSLETAARRARYAFFMRAAIETGCTCVATGHTADDRVESLVLNLLRGAGLDGLSGIPRSRPLDGSSRSAGPPSEGKSLRVVRPLLEIRRAETEAYCEGLGLTPCDDMTNRSFAFARNRVRHQVLPALQAEATPGLHDRLLTLAELAEEEAGSLERLAGHLLREAVREESVGRISLAVAPLAAAPAALARRALRQAVRALDGEATLSFTVTDALLRLVTGELTTGITLPGGRVHAVQRGNVVNLVAVGEPALTPRPPLPILGEGEGLLLTGSPLPGLGEGSGVRAGSSGEPPHLAGEVHLPIPGHATHLGHDLAAREIALPTEPAGDPVRWVLVDADKVAGALGVRAPLPGDRVRPLGMRGRRKLQDLFVDAKLPRERRGRVPVVVDREKIVWVVGFCVSDEVRLDASTRRVVRLDVRPSPSPST
jgi:tRNA(Ile)-lysidine synthase